MTLNLFRESSGSQELSDVSSYCWSLRLALFALFCVAGRGTGWWPNIVATWLKTILSCQLDDICLWWMVGMWLFHVLIASAVTQIPVAVGHLRMDSISPWWTLDNRKEVSWLCWDSKHEFHHWSWRQLFVHFGGRDFPQDTITVLILKNLPVCLWLLLLFSFFFLSICTSLQLHLLKGKIRGQKFEEELKWKSQLTLPFPCTSLLRYQRGGHTEGKINKSSAEVHGFEEKVFSEEWWGQGLIKPGFRHLPAPSVWNKKSSYLIRQL